MATQLFFDDFSGYSDGPLSTGDGPWITDPGFSGSHPLAIVSHAAQNTTSDGAGQGSLAIPVGLESFQATSPWQFICTFKLLAAAEIDMYLGVHDDDNLSGFQINYSGGSTFDVNLFDEVTGVTASGVSFNPAVSHTMAVSWDGSILSLSFDGTVIKTFPGATITGPYNALDLVIDPLGATGSAVAQFLNVTVYQPPPGGGGGGGGGTSADDAGGGARAMGIL